MRPFRRKPKKLGNFAFIDSQNLNLGVQKAGWKIDWKKFRHYLRHTHNVTTAYLFIGYMVEHEAMYEQLHEAGFLIVLKPTVSMSPAANENRDTKSDKTHHEEKKPTVKGNIDAELVLYAMKDLPKYEKAIIVSGDGDFYCLAEYLADKGKLRHIMTPNWQYSSLLKPYESYIIRIDHLRRELEHIDYRKKKYKKKQ